MVSGSFSRSELEHERALEAIISDLGIIGENSTRAHYILTGMRWYSDHSGRELSNCDMIIVYHYGLAVLIELKKSTTHRDKAIEQLNSAEEFVREALHVSDVYKKIVYYGGPKLYVEVVG